MDHYIKEDKGGVRLQAPICDRQEICELSSEFSLPDYQPEIKRLLRVRATVSPPDKYVGAGNAEFSGSVDYAVLYAAGDGALYCANESAEYRFSIPVELSADFEWNDGITCDCELCPDPVVGRVLAPRRFSVKCRLRTRVRMWGTRCLHEKLVGGERADLQRLSGSAEAARIFCGGGEDLQLADEILLESGGDARVITADGQVFVSEASAGSGVVNCRGEVSLRLLVANEGSDALPVTIVRRIPFSSEIPTDGAEVNCEACASGICRDLHVTVEENRVTVEVGVALSSRAQRNETVSFTRDLYAVGASCEASYVETPLFHVEVCRNGNFSLNTTLPLEEAGIRAGASLIELTMLPTVTALEQEGGKYRLSGKCRCLCVLCEEGEYGVQEFELPFRYECEGGTGKPDQFRATVDVISCRARLDGARIGVDAELAVGLSTCSTVPVRMLAEASFGTAVESRGALCTVCYPAREDSLWSISKRYHRPVDSVARANGLSDASAADAPASLSGVKYLLV